MILQSGQDSWRSSSHQYENKKVISKNTKNELFKLLCSQCISKGLCVGTYMHAIIFTMYLSRLIRIQRLWGCTERRQRSQGVVGEQVIPVLKNDPHVQGR